MLNEWERKEAFDQVLMWVHGTLLIAQRVGHIQYDGDITTDMVSEAIDRFGLDELKRHFDIANDKIDGMRESGMNEMEVVGRLQKDKNMREFNDLMNRFVEEALNPILANDTIEQLIDEGLIEMSGVDEKGNITFGVTTEGRKFLQDNKKTVKDLGLDNMSSE